MPAPTTCQAVYELLFSENGNPRRIRYGAEFGSLFLNVLSVRTLKLALKKKGRWQEVNADHVTQKLKDPNLRSALSDMVSTLTYESVPVAVLTSSKHEASAKRVCSALDLFVACEHYTTSNVANFNLLRKVGVGA